MIKTIKKKNFISVKDLLKLIKTFKKKAIIIYNQLKKVKSNKHTKKWEKKKADKVVINNVKKEKKKPE